MRHERSPNHPLSPEADLRREHRRLRRAFTTLVFALAPAALVEACGSAGSPGGDAGVVVEAGADGDAGGDAPDADAGKRCDPLLTEGDASPDAEQICLYVLPCGLSPDLTALGCNVYTGPASLLMPLDCSLMEGDGCLADAYSPGDGGGVTLICPGCLGASGRRPRGLVEPPALRAPTALGAYFARMAYDEAASVLAFRRMRDELARLGAPSALVRAAERSARDEERHARLMARRARRLGAPVASPRVRPGKPRSLEAIARENAVEGCVIETFGALVMQWQAAHAGDASLRRTFAGIAADETRHAALSWAVARWAEGRLDVQARARVSAARARALRSLGRGARASSFDAPVGRPDPGTGAALLAGMVQQLGFG